jgi:hypothetical protein
MEIEEVRELKIEYIEPAVEYDGRKEHARLVRFVSLFAQVGFQEIALNPSTTIHKNYSENYSEK